MQTYPFLWYYPLIVKAHYENEQMYFLNDITYNSVNAQQMVTAE